MRPFSYLAALLLLFGTPALRAQLVNIEAQRITGTKDSVRWYGHLRGSAAVVKVKQQSIQLQTQAKVQYKRDPHLTLLLLNLNLLRAGDKDFARHAFAHLRYNYKIGERWTWEAFAQIQTSPIQLLTQRSLLGTGSRIRLFKSEDGRQRVYLGTAWLWEENVFSEPAEKQAWHRSSNYLSMTLRPWKEVALIGTTYWQPVWGYIRNYRFSTDWMLKVDITSKLAFTIDVEYRLDQNLPPGAPAETYAWRNGLMWQL